MRSTSLSISGAGSRAYVRWMYAVWSWFYDLSIALDPAFRRGAAATVEATVADDDRVLDLGIGTGLLAELGAARAAQWIGLDHSPSMLARARRKLARRGLTEVTLQQGDALHPPYEAGSFDAVVSSFMLPHFGVHEKPAVLAEMARLLRPGGRLGLFLAQGEEAPLFSTRAQLERWLSQGGFTEVVIEDRDDVYRVVTARAPGKGRLPPLRGDGSGATGNPDTRLLPFRTGCGPCERPVHRAEEGCLLLPSTGFGQSVGVCFFRPLLPRMLLPRRNGGAGWNPPVARDDLAPPPRSS